MEQRVYHGRIDPEGLADYLVATFSQRRHLAAQKIGQGNQLLVQIGRPDWSHGGLRHAIGVSIMPTADGVSVAVGQSNWFDSSVTGSLIGALWYPPLLLFPLLRGVRTYALYSDIWEAIDTYCQERGASVAQTMEAHGALCPRCGAMNREDARFCSMCGGEIHAPAASGEVICGECHQSVPAGRFCSNCGAALAGAR